MLIALLPLILYAIGFLLMLALLAFIGRLRGLVILVTPSQRVFRRYFVKLMGG